MSAPRSTPSRRIFNVPRNNFFTVTLSFIGNKLVGRLQLYPNLLKYPSAIVVRLSTAITVARSRGDGRVTHSTPLRHGTIRVGISHVAAIQKRRKLLAEWPFPFLIKLSLHVPRRQSSRNLRCYGYIMLRIFTSHFSSQVGFQQTYFCMMYG